MTVSMAGVYPERLPYFASRDTSSTILCTVHKENSCFFMQDKLWTPGIYSYAIAIEYAVKGKLD